MKGDELLEDIKQRRGRVKGYRKGIKGFNQRMRYLNTHLKNRKEKYYHARSLLRAAIFKD
jgi:hypothetical protein